MVFVKADYRFLIEDELSSIAGPSGPPPPPQKSTWKGLWKLKIPNRIKTLLWRAASDALPSRVNLMKRKVLFDATCQACGSEPESSLHALWMCSKLDIVWDAHFGPLRNDTKDCSNFLKVVQVCMEKGHPTDLVAMTTSLIWTRRNKLRLGESVSDLRLLCSMARDAFQEFHHAHTPAPSLTHTRSLTKWEPPPLDSSISALSLLHKSLGLIISSWKATRTLLFKP